MNKELLEAAVHESAHLVKAYCDGAILRSASISETENSVVHINHPAWKVKNLRYDSPEMKDWVAFQLAGTCAELYYACSISSKKPLGGSDSDIRVAFDMMKKKGWVPPYDGYTEEDFFRDFSMPAKMFCISHASEIRALANLLIKKKKLSGYDAARFLTNKGLKPEKALPLHMHKKEE